jgi:UDP-N-acetyl-D-mannosaminuronate dehydrogenase
MNESMKDKNIYIVGLGYVGLPLAKAPVMENKSV